MWKREDCTYRDQSFGIHRHSCIKMKFRILCLLALYLWISNSTAIVVSDIQFNHETVKNYIKNRFDLLCNPETFRDDQKACFLRNGIDCEIQISVS